jgi:pimeloyl-ACP methyl ester carboxylesterase
MPYIDNNGVKIHYESEGEGPPVLMVHGMGGSTNDWRRAGYPEKLAGEYRLILVDSRGFGKSDKLKEPELYGREQKASDIVGVLDDLGIDKAYYWGYSMGASIGWAVGMLKPERFHALILGAYPVLSPDVPDIDRIRWQARSKLMRLGMDVYIAAMEMDRGPLPDDMKNRLLANDKDAYAAQQIANISFGAPDEDIRNMALPALVYSGTQDEYPMPRNHALTKRSASLAPHAIFLPLEGHTHASAFAESDVIIPHVRDFIAGIESSRIVQS